MTRDGEKETPTAAKAVKITSKGGTLSGTKRGEIEEDGLSASFVMFRPRRNVTNARPLSVVSAGTSTLFTGTTNVLAVGPRHAIGRTLAFCLIL